MALRLCPRLLPMRLNPTRTSRPFTSLCKSSPRPRIPMFQQPLNRPVLGHLSRRQFWGMKKETTDTMEKAGKTFAEICLRITLYGGAFILVGIAGFFIYDSQTYHPRGRSKDINIPHLAMNPRKFGPDQIPVADCLIDDEDTPEHTKSAHKQKLVILGTGWASVSLLKDINPDEYHIVVISPTNYFLFTPLLPSATVGTLEPRSLVEPIRKLLRRSRAHYIEAHAQDVDMSNKLVLVNQADKNGSEQKFYVPYDKLVIAVGSDTNTHGVEGLEHVHFLKTIVDARGIRNHLMDNFEKACLPTTSDEQRKELLSFVVAGGGPTGVEFASELADMIEEDLIPYFPALLRNQVSVHIVQSQSHILNTYDQKISDYAERKFGNDKIDVITNARVCKVAKDRIWYTTKDATGAIKEHELPAGLIVWSTGVTLNPITQKVKDQLARVQKNRHALETDSHLRVLGAPLGDVYAVGDCSTVQNNIASHIVDFLRSADLADGKDPSTTELTFQDWRKVGVLIRRKFPQAANHLKRLDQVFYDNDRDHSGTLDYNELQMMLTLIDGKLTSLPATAQRAHQQGTYLAKKLNKLAKVQTTLQANDIHEGDIDDAVYDPFNYRHLGNLAYLGNSAVFDRGTGGYGSVVMGHLIAMYLWRSVYWSQQVSFRTRALLAFDWFRRAIWGRDFSRF